MQLRGQRAKADLEPRVGGEKFCKSQVSKIIILKNKILVFKRFVSYFHQLHETPKNLVHSFYSFKKTLGRVKDRHHLSREGGIKGLWICLSPPRLCSIRRLPFTCNQCSVISAYYMITYDYVSLCYSWILNVTCVDKRAHLVHYATLLR